MAEYKVTFEAVIPGFFSNKTVHEMVIFEADSGQDAMDKGKQYVKDELSKRGISEYALEESSASVNIVNVEKL